jgi:hypothetical protein
MCKWIKSSLVYVHKKPVIHRIKWWLKKLWTTKVLRRPWEVAWKYHGNYGILYGGWLIRVDTPNQACSNDPPLAVVNAAPKANDLSNQQASEANTAGG